MPMMRGVANLGALNIRNIQDDSPYYVSKGCAGPDQKRVFRRGIPKVFWDDALSEIPVRKDDNELLQKKLITITRQKKRKKRGLSLQERFSWEEISAAILRYEPYR